MKVKQISLRCFEIEHSGADELKTYLEANAEILKQYLILMVGDRDEACEKVLEKDFVFAWTKRDRPLVSKAAAAQQKQADAAAVNLPANSPANSPAIAAENGKNPPHKTLFVRKNVRSGEIITTRGDALFFAQINNGAEIFVKGNCFLFAPLYGQCFAFGESAIVTAVGSGGLFVFHEKPFKSSFFSSPKRFFWNNDEIIIENHQ